ncbi:guanylate kinase [Helicobacter sp. 11S02629-2]|uniref:guanylate kinase n=1 Tax=Helicobacter sp. 11S02629-2 TaxID=1476195 RepID=UPI000BA70820|nr:guanylate kinase [Helicobacter sp. 11S02629-2]PAF44945.1 guanylate kinase [Helicobacter sp. 11S02629-2]
MQTDYKMLILSGPSGAGKSTLCKYLVEKFPDIYLSISSTTRAKREGETEGKEYFFISEEEFKKGVENNEFLEWANVHGNYYGTSLVNIQKAIDKGKVILFEIDVQGFNNIKKIYPNAFSAFITTKNIQTLKSRLEFRHSESDAIIDMRLKNAIKEMQEVSKFSYLIVNEDIEESKKALSCIITSLYYVNSANISLSLTQNWQINIKDD